MHCVKMKQACARSSMSERYQCQQRKKGFGPILVGVIFNGDAPSIPAPEEVTPYPPAHGTCRKDKRALSIMTHLWQAKEVKETRLKHWRRPWRTP